jgi:hypothetical protein
MRQRIRPHLDVYGARLGALAAFLQPRRAVPVRTPQPAALPAGVRIIDPPVQALRKEAQRIRDTQHDHLAVFERGEAVIEVGRRDRKVPILCMPAILMTRLHPTHRGVERFALPLGPPLSRLAQDEERRCAGRKTRSRGRLGQQETAMNDDSRPGNRPNCSRCNAPDTERLYSGGGNSEFKSQRSSR